MPDIRNYLTVKGPHFHIPAFASLFPDRGHDQYSTSQFEALLVPEPDNPYDKNAIAVRVEGRTIGRLARTDATEYAPALHRLAASGYALAVDANLSVRPSYAGPRADPYVDADVYAPPPQSITPHNTLFPANLTLMPGGKSTQVLKEDDHFEHLFNYLQSSGTGAVILTLHPAHRTLRNGQDREYLEVRLDGERVGELSTQTSAHFLPAARHASDMDRTLGVWGTITGSGIAAELTFRAARAAEVPDSWLNEMPTFPALVPIADTYDIPRSYDPTEESQPQRSADRDVSGATEAGQDARTRSAHDLAEKSAAVLARENSRGCGCLLMMVGLLFILSGLLFAVSGEIGPAIVGLVIGGGFYWWNSRLEKKTATPKLRNAQPGRAQGSDNT